MFYVCLVCACIFQLLGTPVLSRQSALLQEVFQWGNAVFGPKGFTNSNINYMLLSFQILCCQTGLLLLFPFFLVFQASHIACLQIFVRLYIFYFFSYLDETHFPLEEIEAPCLNVICLSVCQWSSSNASTHSLWGFSIDGKIISLYGYLGFLIKYSPCLFPLIFILSYTVKYLILFNSFLLFYFLFGGERFWMHQFPFLSRIYISVTWMISFRW